MNALKNLMHNPPKVRPDTCETHGEFESRCFYGETWTRCQQCEREQLERERIQEVARKRVLADQAWQSRIGNSGIPERFRDRSLDNYLAETPGQKHALEFSRKYAAEFGEVIKTGRSALFIGSPGTGKTHLAVGIGMQIMPKHSVLFTTVLRAARRVKDTWNRESTETETKAIAALVYPDLLILDEVGVQFGSEAEKLILFDVLNERYEKRRPTILMSNLSLDGVRAYLGERIFDRLREGGGKCIVFDWESHRGRA